MPRFFIVRKLFVAGFILIPVLSANESICLKSGFCLEARSHRLANGVLLIESGNGSMELPADQLDEISLLPTLNAAPGPQASGADLGLTKSSDLEGDVKRAAVQAGIEPDFVRSVAAIESGLRPNAISNKGALGLMQLTPSRAALLGVNPKIPRENALGGAAFLRQLLLRYNGNSALALAAYNAGPGAVAKYNGVPPYLETRRYIIRVLQEYQRRQHSNAAK